MRMIWLERASLITRRQQYKLTKEDITIFPYDDWSETALLSLINI